MKISFPILRNPTSTYPKLSPLPETIITTDEFFAALCQSRGRLGVSDNEEWQQKKMGLAISGGVDSMALAFLCSNLQLYELPNYRRLKFHGFIIDHGVREGSEREALSVAKILANRGIPASIWKIKWQVRHPHLLPNFESLARKHRYRLLGKACFENKIDSLILGHHEDDQAELIMMRIIAGHRGRGLMGMKSRSAIPECYGIYGVHESGGGMIGSDINCQYSPPISKSILKISSNQAWQQNQNKVKLLEETGGIQIYRPLLNISKTRLVSTCEAYQIPWFEDKSNHNAKFTQRNTIRHLFRCHTIPDALSKPSLIKLAKRISINVQRLEQDVNRHLSKLYICSFDSASGTIKVEFPNFINEKRLADSEYLRLFQIAAEILRKVISLVTPQEHVELSSLQTSVTRIFPELLNKTPIIYSPPSKSPQVTNFTVAGVLFQPISLIATPSQSLHVSDKCIWLISRQPVPRLYFHNHIYTIPATQENNPPILFDGRFWIKIKNTSQSHNLILRFFEAADLKLFISQFKSLEKAIIIKKLSKLAPGNIRWTLPIICARQIAATSSNPFQPLSLPSLKIDVPGASAFGAWQTHYKKIYTDHMNIPN
ncbi:putative pp-loop family protein [Erysiphe necator]|uniref:tRNA(Ile)-lysidine synthetase n=1 Tax=Uncinula necator TaxID=52586 RepID=A0A0B1P8Q1_UNCNE|nr:putative pp-loop family protein [Erysiphe necator]